MAATTAAASDAVETAVLALHSALRRRGVAVKDGDQAGEVYAEHAGRRIGVVYRRGEWLRSIPGTSRFAVVSRDGEEEFLARWIANELLGQL